ncbi:(2Fe-2S)-binding protein [miscellaneous Crenarchaeota group-15 archaeon DG-45]|uniref:(2Fe-2S)-binding protein n=1 Tax=miscellaneous Crenarchaeota group-15 archaeon DG-45 TaxID=1685127 RepID=A0A0M0BN38_9ARCH|nr:MAG: (2Fe-2S)-binding protein [miscellaneous Crenarchaeota group-15 archaeon DG-45]
MMNVEFTLNGIIRRFDVEPNQLLLNLLRENLYMTGTKYGCGIGECGACTVLVDGEPVLSCLTLVVDVDGRNVETIEGLAEGDDLDVIQQAYLEEGAVQCGFCTPGFIMTTKALLKENPNPTEEEIREYLKGNYCRCTGYVNIIKAVKKAAEK